MSRGFWGCIGVIAVAVFALVAFESPAARTATHAQPVTPGPTIDGQVRIARAACRRLQQWRLPDDRRPGKLASVLPRVFQRVATSVDTDLERYQQWGRDDLPPLRMRYWERTHGNSREYLEAEVAESAGRLRRYVGALSRAVDGSHSSVTGFTHEDMRELHELNRELNVLRYMLKKQPTQVRDRATTSR